MKQHLEKDLYSCRQCGYCCQGQTTVSLTEQDQANLQNYLRLSGESLREKYLRVSGSVVQMKTVNGRCIFYSQGCSVHPAKPHRCGQWPLHPSILLDPSNFEAIRESCPGISRRLDYESFSRVLAQYLEDEE